jgi:hypothetical protein
MSSLRQEVEAELGFKISDKDFSLAHKRAQEKLQQILHRYGDSDGARRSADYMISLTAEAFLGQSLSDACMAWTKRLADISTTL